MKKIIITCFLSAFLFESIAIAGVGKACNILKCESGDKAVTYATKSEPYYACQTKELSIYTNFMLGLAATTVMFTGHLPNFSDKTGEPEYPDINGKPNETRLMIEMLRRDAKVNNFFEAGLSCENGKSKIAVTIMNGADFSSAWVIADKSQKSFWMPKAFLNKK